MARARDAFSAIETLMTERLPMEVAYKVRQIWRALKVVAEDYATLVGKKMEEFAERDEEGNVVRPTPGQIKLADRDGFLAAVAAFDNEEAAVLDGLPVLTKEELKGISMEGWVLDALIEAKLLDIGS